MGQEITRLAPLYDAETKPVDPRRGESLNGFDVAIDFTDPAAAISNIRHAAAQNVHMLMGTTGWYEKLPEAEEIIAESGTKFLYSPNFAHDVLFFTDQLRDDADLFEKNLPGLKVEIEETHHISKKDSPSGTAIMIRQALQEVLGDIPIVIRSLRSNRTQLRVHRVIFKSEGREVKHTHMAYGRLPYAQGALDAARWLVKQPAGFYSYKDWVADLLKT